MYIILVKMNGQFIDPLPCGIYLKLIYFNSLSLVHYVCGACQSDNISSFIEFKI